MNREEMMEAIRILSGKDLLDEYKDLSRYNPFGGNDTELIKNLYGSVDNFRWVRSLVRKELERRLGE